MVAPFVCKHRFANCLDLISVVKLHKLFELSPRKDEWWRKIYTSSDDHLRF